MQDIIGQLREWVDDGHPVALAMVVETWGSSPRPVGACMAVRENGSMLGSVSGGCVEGAVVQEALEVLEGGLPRLVRYGVSDETAWDVGLACGGSIEIFIQRFNPDLLHVLEKAANDRQALTIVVVLRGPVTHLGAMGIFHQEKLLVGTLGEPILQKINPIVVDAMATGESAWKTIEIEGESVEIFIHVLPPAPMLIMIGGVHISVALSGIARSLGYRTVVIDPRKNFASQDRFPDIDHLIQSWPEDGLMEAGIDSHTAIAVLTHDPKIDDPALLVALRSPAFYIGVLGSRATHAKRVERLREADITNQEVARLRAPIGLDLGGGSPEEIALAIMAEITATRYGVKARIG